MKKLCAKCGGKCCRPDGPYLSEAELMRLPAPFYEKVEGNLYRLVGEKGKCLYLGDEGCGLADKPLACLLFPFLPTRKGWVLRTKCPYWHKLEPRHLSKAKRVFEKRKEDWKGAI